ncbi:MAG: Gfo/Idh/MocA family oxidoreductase [Cyanobacteria bacterium J06627_28]
MSSPQVIVVGAGNWGKNLVKNFHALGALAGVAEASPDLRERVAEQYPDVPLFADYAEALKTDAVAVVFATPAPTHYKFARAALEAGKDVFIEKPMTLEVSEAKWLAEYADANDRIVMVGHLLLYQPAIAWMRDYLASGKAGKVRHISAQRLKLGRVRAQENVWWSFAPHDVSVVLELLGRPKLKSVSAQGQAMVQPTVEDYVHVDLTFEGGLSAHVHSSWYWPTIERRTTVLCEKQILVYDEVAQTVTIHNQQIDGESLKHSDEGSQTVDIASVQPLKLECEHFLDCVKTRSRPRSDGWNGVAVVEILERAHNLLRK